MRYVGRTFLLLACALLFTHCGSGVNTGSTVGGGGGFVGSGGGGNSGGGSSPTLIGISSTTGLRNQTGAGASALDPVSFTVIRGASYGSVTLNTANIICTGLPSWASLSTVTQKISFAPGTSDTTTATFSCYDSSLGLTSTKYFSAATAAAALAFSGNSLSSASVMNRLLDQNTGYYDLTGVCDPELGKVVLNGSGLKQTNYETDCAAGGTFTQRINFDTTAPYIDNSTSDKAVSCKKVITATQASLTAVQTALFQIATGKTAVAVSSATDLQNMATSDTTKQYILTQNIDLSTVAATNNWTAILQFFSWFEGNDLTISKLNTNSTNGALFVVCQSRISNLTIDQANVTDTTGNAGTVCEGSTATSFVNVRITNSTLSGANIAINGGTGGFVGNSTSTYLYNSSYSGNISGNTSTGGFIGYAPDAYVYDSYFSGNISATNQRLGGIMGYFWSGTVTRSYSTGTVSGTGNVGGVVGYFRTNTATAINSYSSANVSGTANQVGGFAGYSQADDITDCYATGNVSGANSVGGFIGVLDHQNSEKITNAYATGNVSGLTGGSTNVGPFLGSQTAGSTLTNAYRLSTASCTNCTNTTGTSLTAVQFAAQASFTGFDFTTNWKFPTSSPTRPLLLWQ